MTVVVLPLLLLLLLLLLEAVEVEQALKKNNKTFFCKFNNTITPRPNDG